MKIMVVDDELISRKKLAEILKSYGSCSEYDRGDRALIEFEETLKTPDKYNLITVDISMPLLDGFLVLQKIRNLESDFKISEEQRCKVVMVTSSADKDKVIKARRQGCDHYILKPFNEEDILQTLSNLQLIT